LISILKRVLKNIPVCHKYFRRTSTQYSHFTRLYLRSKSSGQQAEYSDEQIIIESLQGFVKVLQAVVGATVQYEAAEKVRISPLILKNP
jgi:hypothetical protein